nr:VP0 [Passerivirus A1]
GQTITNIYGDGNWVTSSTGANGWSPSVNTNLADGTITSTNTGSPAPQNPNGPSNSSRPNKPRMSTLGRVNDQLAQERIRTLRAGSIGMDIPSQAPITQPLDIPPRADVSYLGEPFRPGPQVDRFWEVSHAKWNLSDTGLLTWDTSALQSTLAAPCTKHANFGSGTHLNFPYSILNSQPGTAISNAFSTHSYWRGDALIQVTVNSSPQASGVLLVAAIPEGVDVLTPQSATHYPFTLLNLATTNCCALLLPFLSPNPVDPCGLHFQWNVVALPITPLRVPAGTPSFLDVSCMMAPQDSEFFAMKTPAQQ